MQRIRAQLRELANKLGITAAELNVAQRRVGHFRKRTHRNHAAGERAAHKADRLRAKYPGRAAYQDRKAARCHHRAHKAHDRAQWWIGRCKSLVMHQKELQRDKAQLEQEARKWRREHGPSVNGNKVTGGEPRERLVAAAITSMNGCVSGRRHNFYSQFGNWDVDHCITGETWGHRSDCSSWFTSVYKAAGLSDPNSAGFSGGYTGTLGSHGHAVSHPQPGDAVLYGYFPFHHVEMYVGPGDLTIGHGTSPIDHGSVHALGGPVQFRSYV